MSIVRLRPRLVDNPYDPGGDKIPDPSDPERVPLHGVSFTPGDAAEGAEGAPVVETGTLGFVIAGSLTESDEVEIFGQKWRVTGVLPSPENPFTGWSPGGTATVRRVR